MGQSEIKQEITEFEVPVVRVKRKCSEAQLSALEKGRAKRMENKKKVVENVEKIVEKVVETLPEKLVKVEKPIVKVEKPVVKKVVKKVSNPEYIDRFIPLF